MLLIKFYICRVKSKIETYFYLFNLQKYHLKIQVERVMDKV